MYVEPKTCRGCSGTELIPVFDLGIQPLANDFCKEGQERAGFVPLKVLFCKECSLSQLSAVVSPEILYKNYPYVTSKSETMQTHFRLLWQAIKGECNPITVAELGSNDGDFLQFAKNNGAKKVIGFDPAQNLAYIATNKRGLKTLPEGLNAASAELAMTYLNEPISLIIARHVFCHINDWKEFMEHLARMADKDTLVVIEVPWVKDLLDKVELDSIYSEHTSYMSVQAMQALLRDTKFYLHKVMRFEIHGGAIVLMLRHKDRMMVADESVEEFLSEEDVTEERWRQFSVKAHAKIDQLKKVVAEKVYGEGETVCGFGASAKSTVWINACGFTKKEIAFICDCTPSKQGRFSPGTDIPILPESALLERMPKYAICFAWNFLNEVLAKNKAYRDAGGKFIVPDSEIRVV